MSVRRAAGNPASLPRVLVTGFSVFPGEPVNPTEELVVALRAAASDLGHVQAFRADVLDVDYATIAERLTVIGRESSPDIAIHFGLARACSGFRLERLARNSHGRTKPDNSGVLPAGEAICAGPASFCSTLPLDRIAARLEEAGYPVEWSDDAGGYLCNTVFTLSAAHACDGFQPEMAGFIHVPPLREAEPNCPSALGVDELHAGARIVISACVEAWLDHGK